MGKVHDGKIVTTSGFQFNANAPLDDRAVVEAHADLNDLTAYEGIEVYVKAEKKSYKYMAGNWVAVATEDYVTKAIENLNIQAGSMNVLTPEMFGAVGDGSTDDTAALQAMIDAATDGKVFLFTSANGYRVGSTLNIRNKHHLTFAHANLIFGDSSTSRLEACIKIWEGSSNISFENCSFRYGSQVIWLWACENIRVSHCTFDGCGYCVIQQLGYVSDHVFVTDNLAKNCVQDFVECNCEVDAPSKNWTVTGNIYIRDEKPVAPMKTECRFLGATAIRNVIISDNIIENVQGDSCISMEDPYGEIVIDGNTFTDCIGRGYVHIIHGDKNTIVSNNHFVNTIADNETPFIYLYDSGTASPYTKEFSVLVEGNMFNGNGTQKNPLVNIDYTSYPFIIKNNVFRNIGVMFDHVGGENISFDGNDVMCETFFLVDTTKAGYTKNSTFSSNRIVGDITITNDYNGKVCSGLSFTGNYLDGTVSITNAKDILFAQNTFSKNSVFTFDANGYYSERMERYGNFQVGVGIVDTRIVQTTGTGEEYVMSQKAATENFALKGDMVEQQKQIDNIEGMLFENVEYIDAVVSDNKFDNNFDATGKIDLTTGADASASTLHRTSEYHELWDDFDGTIYIGHPAATSTSEQKVQVVFYDADKTYLGYEYIVAADSAYLGRIQGTVENMSQARYYRVCKTISWDVQIYVSPIKPSSADEIDYTYEIGKIPVTTGLAVNAPKKLQGKVIVNFGDSIFGKRRPPDDISTKLADLTGATVHNCGFGGCHMSNHWASTYNAFSMCNLADAIVNGTWTAQDNALLETGSNAVPSYFSEGLNILKTLDFSKVDIITIAYGTNDWNSGDEIDNEENQKSKDTYAGALRYSIETLLGTYPNLKIFICSQTYRFFLDDGGNYIDDSDTKTNTNNVKLTDFVVKTKEIARAYHLPFIDNYYSLGLNKFNRTVYFSNSQGAVTDGTHPNTVGCHLIAENMANELF